MPNIPTLMPVLGLLATAVAAFVIILKGLVIPVLLALLVYAWSCLLADRIVQAHKPSALSLGYYPKRWPAVISGTVVSVLVITAFVFLTYWTIHLASSNDLRIFLVRIEDSLEVLRQALPEAAAKVIPENWADLKAQLFNVVRSKAAVLSSVGGAVVHTIVQSLFAILVGALAAVSTWQPHRLRSDRLFIARLLVVLERVAIAQMRIALFNTTMTALYLFVVLPLFQIQLPFRGLLCMFTLLTGVLPVLGNLMANTVLSLISFAVSPWVAVSSLVFLVLIHKLEYVINARGLEDLDELVGDPGGDADRRVAVRRAGPGDGAPALPVLQARDCPALDALQQRAGGAAYGAPARAAPPRVSTQAAQSAAFPLDLTGPGWR